MSEQLTYTEIKKRLKKPIEQSYISTKTVGGTQIKFVSVTDLKDLIDERIKPNHWEAIVKSTTVCGDNLLMIVSLIIHTSDGAYCQDGTGIESLSVRGYGDTGSNSFSQAYRRAAESHGLGRELWRMELSDEQKEIVKEDAKPPLAARILRAQDAIKNLGGTIEAFDIGKANDAERQAELDALTDQYRRLKAAKG